MDDRAVLIEVIRRARAKASKPDFLGALFKQQKDFALDKSKSKAALCTRRAGKSYSAGSLLYDAAYNHVDCVIPYISLTRKSAKNIMWPVMRKIKKQFKLSDEDCKLIPSELTVRFPKLGVDITLFGADQENFIERLRGGAYPLVVIDEAQSFREHLQELVEDVIEPALIDYDGTVVMLGTAGPLTAGYFFEITEKKKHGFSNHTWSILDNVHLPNAAQWLANHKKKKGWSDDNPTYLREYCAKWVYDPDALVYKFQEGRNEYDVLPTVNAEWHRILSVDYGSNDKTTFGITSYNAKMPDTFLEYAWGRSGLIPSQISEIIKKLITQFNPISIVADSGALGKMITDEMRRRYQIPMEAIDKRDKQTWIALMNGEMIDGRYKIQTGLTNVKGEMQTLTRDDKGLEDPHLPNDFCDVALYGFRKARSYLAKPDEKPKTKEEKIRKEEQDLIESLEESIIRNDEAEWWER